MCCANNSLGRQMKFIYVEEDVLKWELIEISEALKDFVIDSTVLSNLKKVLRQSFEG